MSENDPWETEYRRCWRAAAAAYFAAMAFNTVSVKDIEECPDDINWDYIFKVAETVGAEFAERASK